MLRCEHITVRAPGGQPLLTDVSAHFQPRAMNAIVGPSGCGKTTLVKALLRLTPAEGTVTFEGRPVTRAEDLIGRVGFAPQFSIAQPQLTVGETLHFALALTVADPPARAERHARILALTGLAEHAHKRVAALSGGQLRRLGLGLEFTTQPPCLICDEVTSGLDPNSEDQLLHLLRALTREPAQPRTFVNIIHNLAKLELFDWITVLHEGRCVFQGTCPELNAHFGLADPLHLYDRLAGEKAPAPPPNRPATPPDPHPAPRPEPATAASGTAATAGAASQTLTLLRRRFLLLARDRGYLALTAAITFGFPCLVVIFALGGIPQFQGLALEPPGGPLEQFQSRLAFELRAIETAQLVTGLILFQVILLTLMGANNGAREIAAERRLYEKERLLGLRPAAYALSKIAFTALIALAQGLWMTAFVKLLAVFPGPWLPQLAVLAACCTSFTLVALAFSALLTSPEKASLLAIYLVGFQLPLSGVVLALPEFLVWACRPFITTYWAWAAYLSTLREPGPGANRLFDAFRMTSAEWLPGPALALAVLALHALAATAAILYGCHRRRWNG